MEVRGPKKKINVKRIDLNVDQKLKDWNGKKRRKNKLENYLNFGQKIRG